MDYRSAGVDIEAGYESVRLMKQFVARTMRPEVMTDLGGFSGAFSMDAVKGMEHPTLLSGTDGVGTKLKLAFVMDRHDTVGIDCVAMCVNDVACAGGEPLFFLDYIACGKNNPEKIAKIVSGVAEGCVQSGSALIGGETAEMAGFYPDGEYDIAGFSVGVVEKSKIITAEKVQEGDVLLGLPSTGVHSNGFSLVRKIVFERQGMKGDEYVDELGTTIGEALLTPTRLYPNVCLPLIEQFDIHGMVHVTGGGFYDNIPRALPDDLAVEINDDAWTMPPIFTLLQKWGNVDWKEMYRTFNMGIGMILIASKDEAAKMKAKLEADGETVYEIGRVVRGNHDVTIKGGVFHE